ncbi:MAG: DNA methyltransferase, partial [Ignavibacteriae bacterium]|nr:DNA methyltransferase [Ignavibacteriota bacterium]
SIYLQLKENGQIGRWPAYVHHDLLPRIHGFEIMMAPYTIAHLKLSMAFKATGFKHFNRRLGIYLTNSLEEADTIGNLFTGFGFAESIAEESKEASQIKNESPIMVVIGNPPYSVSSSNKGKWITDLIKSYKKDLNERNIQPLSDDYIKFVRFAEHFVEKNKTGIVAMITNNSFLDGIIHRQMRKHLLETFDEIYILDLHGNSKKKETAPDGSKDENVFDIMQGVSISIMIKKSNSVVNENLRPNNDNHSPQHATVKFAELYGKRAEKYKTLSENDLNTIDWETLKITEDNYFFTMKDFNGITEYEKGIKIDELFQSFGPGVETGLDKLFVSNNKVDLTKRFRQISTKDNEVFKRWDIKNKKSFKIKDKLINDNFAVPFCKYNYKIFDFKYIAYMKHSLRRADYNIFKHVLTKSNLFLTLMRTVVDTTEFKSLFVTDSILDKNLFGFQTYAFPLYVYSEDGTKTPNLKTEIVEEIEKVIDYKTEPEEILDYIYAVLHSLTYRKKYKEFLKIDFPRVPYPKEKKAFKELVKFGTELRQIHLLESPKVIQFITTYPNMGSDKVEKPKFKNVEDENIRSLHLPQNNKEVKDDNYRPQPIGNVWINEEQYFGNVPEIAWNFYIGGYQPAQKWLKDRKG